MIRPSHSQLAAFHGQQPASRPGETQPLEYRAQVPASAGLELRAEGHRIVGTAILFDVRSRNLGGFVEVVRPQALDRSLAGGDIVALYNHDDGAVLGRTPKTLTVRKEARGLAFELDPPPTQAGREALELVRRGDLTGASFGFKTITDAWSREGDLKIRTLLDIEVLEISLTALPAYQGTDVAIAQRSMQAAQLAATGQSIRWLRRQETAR